MNSNSILKGVWLLSVLTACAPTTEQQSKAEESRPNILIILADDLGFSDIGSYGGEIQTPHLDQLAYNGMRFTQFYNTSRCCPTRASLLTGLYPHQAGVGKMTFDTGKPGYRGYLTDNTVTIAEMLRDAGYSTGMTGKWHISETNRLEEEKQLKWLAHQADYGPFSDTSTYPTARGFDKFYGTIWGVVDYFDPFSLVNGDEPVKSVPDDFYYTDAITDSTVAYIEQFTAKEKPFFIYMAQTAPHWPLQATSGDIEKYDGRFSEGWEAVRERRYQNIVEKGLLGDSVRLPAWMFPKMDWETNENRIWDSRAMEVHAAMVDRMDQGIGKVIDKLRELNQLDNTIIFFLSDNGASYERPSVYGPGFDRAGGTRDGREVFFPVDKSEDHLPGPQTVHSGIGPQWAHVSNTPFRFYKSKVYEGGICTPLIVHWPDGIASKNTINNSPGHVMDLMATCLEAAQTSYPENYKGKQITPMAGKSLLPLIKGENHENHEYIFWEHFGSKAIRKGPWKLVQLGENSDWELYNLDSDRTETTNVAARHTDLVKELQQKWIEMAEELNVYPAP